MPPRLYPVSRTKIRADLTKKGQSIGHLYEYLGEAFQRACVRITSTKGEGKCPPTCVVSPINNNGVLRVHTFIFHSY